MMVQHLPEAVVGALITMVLPERDYKGIMEVLESAATPLVVEEEWVLTGIP